LVLEAEQTVQLEEQDEPVAELGDAPQVLGVGAGGDAGCRLRPSRVGRSRTSETLSTMSPTRVEELSATTMRVSFVGSTSAIPKRPRRSTTGMIRPRRLITPLTKAALAAPA
jgi:hypothetical protein